MNERKQVNFIFIITTIVFIVTRIILFKGFNGSDDLHYAMLAAKTLRHQYNPFEPHDIFSGRILLIAWQAFIYKIAGISVFSTAIGTIIAVIVSCLLTIYKILPVKNAANVLFACCLFYFNPAIAEAIKGVLPDAYIMLTGVIIFLLLKEALNENMSFRKSLVNNILIAVLIAIALFIKETILVFLPFCILAHLIYKRKRGIANGIYLLLFFAGMIALFGAAYHYFTGDAFFKVAQINNSAYPNPCNFDGLPFKDLLARLNYGTWQIFIVNGFYPVLFAASILLIKFFQWKRLDFKKDFETVCFLLLLLIGLYLPFSLKGYQPLCADTRQFLFLMPLAVTAVVIFFDNEMKLIKNKILLAVFSSGILLVCISSTQDKWQWMIYCMLFICFSAWVVFQKISKVVAYLIIAGILLTSVFENMFFLKTTWFKDMQMLNKDIKATYYYFPDNDNMMHWELLQQFNDSTIHCYNIEKNPFKIFKIYYEYPDTGAFHPGWLIVNKKYTESPASFLAKMDSLQNMRYFSDQLIIGDMSAFLINSKLQLDAIKTIRSPQ